MSRARWSVVALAFPFAIAHAAEGTHPGPLPPPHDRAQGTSANPDYGYPRSPGDGFGAGQPYGTAPGYGAAGGSPQDAWGNQNRGGYGYPTTQSRHGPRGGYGYEGPSAPAGREQPRGYWIWVPAEAVQPAVGDYATQEPRYGGYDYGHPAYPAYSTEEAAAGYPAMPPGYGAYGGGSDYPGFGGGTGGPPPDQGWWGRGSAAEPFGPAGYPGDSGSYDPPPAYPDAAPEAATPRQSGVRAEPAGAAKRSPPAEAGQAPAPKDNAAGFRPTSPAEPTPGGN